MTQPDKSARIDEWETVNRVVFPIEDAELTEPLYISSWAPSHVPPSAFDFQKTVRRAPGSSLTLAQVSAQTRKATSLREPKQAHYTITSRYGVDVDKNSHVTLCTYFNAFPASYWRYWTPVRTIRLELEASGSAIVRLFKSDSMGLNSPAGELTISHASHQIVTIDVPLTGTIDGGFVWFNVQTRDDAFSLHHANWQVKAQAKRKHGLSTFSVAITTFNREPYALRQLKSLANDSLLRERLDTVYCIDQGTHPVSALDDFDNVQKQLGDQLTYIRQGNLGGSGGFSRGMHETVKAGKSSSVILLDDDAINEPEALMRAVQFADYTYHPSLVGAGMLHLDNRAMLYTQAERMNRHTILHEQYIENHDFSLQPLVDFPQFHRRVDSGYNGWWMCLIPVEVMKKIGYAMPVFIKYDDMEYCYRARANGYPTISLPGVAIWHQAWHNKDSSRSWQEYFEQRNRVLFALLTYDKPLPALIKHVLIHESSMGMRFIYSGIAMNNLALKDILAGPETIVKKYPTAIADVNAFRSQFEDAHNLTDDELKAVPLPHHAFYDRGKLLMSLRKASLFGMLATVRSLLLPRSGKDDSAPDIALPAQEANWQTMDKTTSVLVATANSNAMSWNRRDDRMMREAMKEGFELAYQIVKNWETLRKRYRDYGFASAQTWEKLFASSQPSESSQK